VAHLGNIARRVGGRLEWSPAAERFTNSDRANGHLDRERRKGGSSCRKCDDAAPPSRLLLNTPPLDHDAII
jgi:hypothetical protein